MRGRRQKLEIGRNTAGARAAYLRAAQIVSQVTGVAFGDVIAPATAGKMRRRTIRFARQAAIYLAVTGCNVRQAHLARALQRPRVRILWACREAEDARDRAEIDQLYSRMEAML